MITAVYRYRFADIVPLEDVEAALVLALFSVESLHGEAQVQLDAAHWLDSEHRLCVIDASTPVGRDLNRLFVNFLRREFGPETVCVEPCHDSVLTPAVAG